MQHNRNKNKSFLAHKRKDEETKEEENMIFKKEKQSKNITLKKSKLNGIIIKEEKDLYLNEEKNRIKQNFNVDNKNSIQNYIDINKNKICQKCGKENCVITFSSFKDILDYFNKNKARILFKRNILIKKYINKGYKKSLTICRDCLLEMSLSEIKFEKYISMNEIKYPDNNEDPFKNLYDSSYLKYFNDKEKINNNTNILYYETSKNKNGYNIFQNINLNNENINNLNNQFLTLNNYNKLSEQECLNTNLHKDINNYRNINHNLVDQNNNLQNLGLQDNNNIVQNLTNQYHVLNDHISYLNLPLYLIPYNNISNINDSQFLNIDNFNEKNENINSNIAPNNNTKGKMQKEERQEFNNNNQISENNGERKIYKNYTMIGNKDFDYAFQLSRSIYNKLLDFKIKRDLVIDLNKLNQDNKKLCSNSFNSNLTNKKLFNNDTNFDLNQISNNIFKEHYLNILSDYNNSNGNCNETNKFKISSYQNITK